MVDAVVRVDHLEVAVKRHNGHEGDAGRTVDCQHEEIDAAQRPPEGPVFLVYQVVDAEGHADQQQEVGDDQVDKEDDIGPPALHAKPEDPERHQIAGQPHHHLNDHHRGQHGSHHLLRGMVAMETGRRHVVGIHADDTHTHTHQ